MHNHHGGPSHAHEDGDRTHKHNSRGAAVPMIPHGATHVQIPVRKFEALMDLMYDAEISGVWDDLLYVIDLGPVPLSIDKPK